MNKQVSYQIELLTPCFCKIGHDEPEIRGASIRGMIREWKRNAGRRPDTIWGGTGRKASKVGIDIKSIQITSKHHQLLPHKGGTKPKALDKDGTFTLLLNRLVGCTDSFWKEAKRDVETWLLLGCLGQRANRAAGSVWNSDWKFADIDAFETKLRELDLPKESDVRICTTPMTVEQARETASDTVNNPTYFGSYNREPSPTKMKVVKIGDGHHLLLFAKKANILDGALKQLQEEKPDPRRWQGLTFQPL
jgi:hypothetical protein